MSGKRLFSPHYIDEPVAEIAGLPALYSDNKLFQRSSLLIFSSNSTLSDNFNRHADVAGTTELG